MNLTKAAWRMNIPQLLGLPNFQLDDADADESGNVYVSDSLNSQVYKFAPSGALVESYGIDCPSSMSDDSSLVKIGVASNSTFFVTDTVNGIVHQYDERGQLANQYWAPGVLSVCCGSNSVYVLTENEGLQKIEAYDSEGDLVDVLPAPGRSREHTDNSLVNMDVDADGNVYLSYGMLPYRIHKVRADGSGFDTIGRYLDHPEDTVLMADIAVEPASGTLWVLLAAREVGLQIIDSFSLDGKFLCTVGAPQADLMFSIIIASSPTDLYVLDISTAPGAGDLTRVELAGSQ